MQSTPQSSLEARQEAYKRFQEDLQKIRKRMSKVRFKIAVLSGKGGVGKSTVTANLAAAFAMKGYQVGILDADIHGPTIPKLLGLQGARLEVGPPGIFPVKGPLGMRIVSVGFLLPSEEVPVVWRGPLKTAAIRQFLGDVVWGSLDFLLIDLPPGTGDEPLSIAQFIPGMSGAIIVTIPSEVSQAVVKKAVIFAHELKVPVIGILENMSGFICPNCGARIDIFKTGGGEKIARELNVPFLGKIPLDPRIVEDSDAGIPFVVKHPDSSAAKAFMDVVAKVEDFLLQGGKKEKP